MKNEYAFPSIGDGPNAPHFAPGMTLRDYFAAHAIIGLLYESIPSRVIDAGPNSGRKELDVDAETAYEIADAMLAAREMEAQ